MAPPILALIRAAGVDLVVLGDKLKATARRGELTDDIRALIREHKPELIALLTPRDPPRIQAPRRPTLDDIGLVQIRPGVWELPAVSDIDFGPPPLHA